MSFAANFALGGFDVAGYHIFNLVVHLLTSILLYLFIVFTFRTPYLINSAIAERSGLIAFLSGMLFAVHPVQTQAVTYIAQRFTSLAAMFYLASIVLYLKWRLNSSPSRKKLAFYILSLIAALLAAKTKETAVTLPVVLVLYELIFFPLKGVFKRLLLLLPFFLIWPVILSAFAGFEDMAGAGVVDAGGTVRLQTDMSRADYLLTEFRVMATYIRLMFFPINQNLDYDYPIYRSFLSPPVFLSFAFLLSIILLAVYLLRYDKFRPVSFGILGFFVMLLPESSIVPIADVIYEHRLYLPSAGAIFAVVTLAMSLNNIKLRNAATIILIISIAAFSYAAIERNLVWQSSISLWEDAVNKSPKKARCRYNLGNSYAENGMPGKAAEQFVAAIRLKPENVEAYINLGVAYASMGRTEDAIGRFEEAIKLNPGSSGTHYNLGMAYGSLGRSKEAIKHYEAAIRLRPDYAEAMVNLASVSISEGKFDLAIRLLMDAISIRPGNADAHYGLGAAFYKKGMLREAYAEFGKALDIDPSNKEAKAMLERTIPIRK